MKISKYQIYQIIVFVIYISLLIFYSVLSLQTGYDSSNTSDGVTGIIAKIQEFITGNKVEITDSYRNVIRKLFGHYGIFVAIGLFSSLAYMSLNKLSVTKRISIHFVTGFIYAFITEFIFQALTEARGPSFVDVLIDFVGFVTLSIIIVLIYIIKIYKNKQN